MTPIQWTLTAALLLFSATAWSHGDAGGSKKPKAAETVKETAFGKQAIRNGPREPFTSR